MQTREYWWMPAVALFLSGRRGETLRGIGGLSFVLFVALLRRRS